MTSVSDFAFLARSTTCWTRGLPVEEATILPGKRVEEKRAGITPIAAKADPQTAWLRSTPNCGARIRSTRGVCQGIRNWSSIRTQPWQFGNLPGIERLNSSNDRDRTGEIHNGQFDRRVRIAWGRRGGQKDSSPRHR